jgi:hypothetical protein
VKERSNSYPVGDLETVHELVTAVAEDFGRANFKYQGDADYGGAVAEVRYMQLRLALAHMTVLLSRVDGEGRVQK